MILLKMNGYNGVCYGRIRNSVESVQFMKNISVNLLLKIIYYQ